MTFVLHVAVQPNGKNFPRFKFYLLAVCDLLDCFFLVFLDLRTLTQNHKFCGCADAEFALIQHETILYIVNVTKIR